MAAFEEDAETLFADLAGEVLEEEHVVAAPAAPPAPLPIVPLTPEQLAYIDRELMWHRRGLDAADFISSSSGESPPPGNIRELPDNIIERWTPVQRPIASKNFAEIAKLVSNGLIPISGWHVVRYKRPTFCECHGSVWLEGIQDASGKTWLRHTDGCGGVRATRFNETSQEMVERLKTLNLGPEDDATYNGVYPTLGPGDQMAVHDPRARGMRAHQSGNVLRDSAGIPVKGQAITGGRSEWKEKSKDMILWDSGTRKHLDRIKSEKEQARKDANKQMVERVMKQMPRNLGEV